MKHNWRLTKMLALMAAIMLSGGAAAMLCYPHEVSEARLGAEWRCMSTAFFVTTCAQGEDWRRTSDLTTACGRHVTEACETAARGLECLGPRLRILFKTSFWPFNSNVALGTRG